MVGGEWCMISGCHCESTRCVRYGDITRYDNGLDVQVVHLYVNEVVLEGWGDVHLWLKKRQR